MLHPSADNKDHTEKARNIYLWLDLNISKGSFSFSICEDTIFFKYSKLNKTDRDKLLKYAHLMVESVEEKIAKSLPERGGIIFDQ